MVVRVAGFALLLAHLLLVAWVTLRPRDVAWVTAPNLTPLAGIEGDLALGPAEAARRIVCGLLLLAPLGVLLPMADGRLTVSPWASLARTTAAGALVSLAVELLQTAVPGQVVDVDSVLLNTAGVALAHVLFVPAGRARLRRGPRGTRSSSRPGGPSSSGRTAERASQRTSQGPTPTIPRVGIAP
ncbi:VanZ family protein [Streptomyces roseicoloratus]|uniref:VanZ family protein n=1 Tax=Streptomyces roseicoloratus TaxID=2508722 RepID=A0ABY9RT88_9ACTN|nr:VanZ family protein [Streptomyces roseicoloratus]WMX45385.1 VanZ family protein [Streptomyces roseicoloratus]